MASNYLNCTVRKVTSYCQGLDPVSKQRYMSKLTLIGGSDPYELNNKIWIAAEDHPEILPGVTYPDIVNFLIYTPSRYSLEDLKCYKGLEAYNQFVSGWVREVKGCNFNGVRLSMGKVLHSQRMSEKPLLPWVIAETEGKILASHCTCMAGLGETCTHVSALLFAIEARVKIQDSATCTDKKAYWMLPREVRKITYLPLSDNDFTSARSKKKNLDSEINNITIDSEFNVGAIPKRMTNRVPLADEKQLFYQKLHDTQEKCAILSLISPYSDNYLPTLVKENLPLILRDLKQESTFQMNFRELLEHCENITVKASTEEVQNVERLTRSQASSSLWYKFRAGRITASKAKSVCHTNYSSPAQSLIRGICYPEMVKFTTAATAWGCDHEKIAREAFLAKYEKTHENVIISDCGLYINTDLPFVAASPDGILSCDCCGKFCIEVKCPYCKRENIINESMDRNFCLDKLEDNSFKLKIAHQYYYQVQTQLACTNMEYGYFVLWTKKDQHIELIKADPKFWKYMVEKFIDFFYTAIMPELVGKFFSRIPNEANNSKECVTLHCYCNEPKNEPVTYCCNEHCPIKQFHLSCLRLKMCPKGKWYCPDCRKLPKHRRGIAF